MTGLLDPATDGVDFKRDRWGRPSIMQADGKRKGYTRCSSAAKTIEDTFNLEKWARRNVAYGLAYDASLVARIIAIGGEPSTWEKPAKDAFNQIVVDAEAVAKAHKAADIGTAIHKLTERLDRGEDVIGGPYQADLDAYRAAMAGFDVREVECRMVNDELEMAGTADRIVNGPGGGYYIADVKTSATVDFGGLGWAAQLAAYAGGELYDVEREQRVNTPHIDREIGYLIHLPAGQGRCDIYEVDLVAGLAAAKLANEIRATRKASKGWIRPMSSTIKNATVVTSNDAARRNTLLSRFEALTHDQKGEFKGRRIPKGDLDAIEHALDDIVNPPTMREIVGKVGVIGGRMSESIPQTIKPDEGPDVDAADFAPLAAAYEALPKPAKEWCATLLAQSREAGVPFHRANAPTMRRYELYRGLIRLAGWLVTDAIREDSIVWDVATLLTAYGPRWDDTLAALVYAASGGDDATRFANVTAGHALGSLSCEEAGLFAKLVDQLVGGTCHLSVLPSGEMRVVAA